MPAEIPEIKNVAQAYETVERNFFKASIYLLFMAEQSEMLIRLNVGGLDTIVQFTDVVFNQENLSDDSLTSYEYAFRIDGKHMDVDPFFKTLINLKKAREFMTLYLEFWDNFIRNKRQKTIVEAAQDIANFDTLFALACENIFTPIAWLEKDVIEGMAGGPGGSGGSEPGKRKDVGKYIPDPIQKIMGEPPVPDTHYHEGGVQSAGQEQSQNEEPGSAGQITEKGQTKPQETPNVEEGGEESQEQQEGGNKKEKEKQKHEKEWQPPAPEGGEEGEGGGGKSTSKGVKSGKGDADEDNEGEEEEENEENEGEEGENEPGEKEKKLKIDINIEDLKKLIEKRNKWRSE